MRLLSLAILFFLCIACGGGGESSSSDGNSSSDGLSFKLVQPDGRPFRIFSDQSNRDDPIEATHARLNIYDLDGRLLRQEQTEIVRDDEEPYEVDPDLRFIEIENPPTGNLIFEVELGQDFGVTSSNTRSEVIYYSGNANIVLSGGNIAVVDGVETSVIQITITNVVDEERGLYTIQGYLDFTNYPIVIDITSDDDLFDTTLSLPVTTFNPLESNFEVPDASEGNTSYITNNIQIGEIDEPLSYFFEVLNISANFISFSVASETGSPDNFVLRGYVSPSESMVGLPVLIDWETSWTKIMTDWIVFKADAYEEYELPGADYEENYLVMGNVFNKLRGLWEPPESGNTIAAPYVVNAQDLLLTEITNLMFSALNQGDRTSDTVNPVRFDSKIIGPSYGATAGIDLFFLTSGNGLVEREIRSLRVLAESSDNTIDIPINPLEDIILDEDFEPIIDSAGNLTFLGFEEELEEGESLLSEEFQTQIIDVSYNEESLVKYIFSLINEDND